MLKRNASKLFLCLLLANTPVCAVETSPISTAVPDADKLLGTLVEKGIQPLYRELDEAGKKLVETSQAFCSDSSEAHFRAVRDAWGETLLAWQRSDALLFGPAVEEQRDFHINFTPPKKLTIQNLLNGTNPITVEAVEKAGVSAQGLATLEYLLFDREKPDTEQWAAFQGEAGKRRCSYVRASSELLQRDLQHVTSPWSTDKGNYAAAFSQADKSNAHFANSRQAVDTFIGKLYQSAEKIAKNRLGNPLGKGLVSSGDNSNTLNKQSNAYQLENWRSGYALKVTYANMEGIQRLLGDGGILAWLGHQPDKAGQPSHADVVQQLQSRMSLFLQTPMPTTDPFELVSQGKTAELDNLYHIAEDLRLGIRKLLAPAMGVQLGFNDNDGD